LKTSGEHNSE